MKFTLPLLLLLAFTSFSCSSTKGLFEKKTPHEKYADKLEDKGLERTPEGRQWLAASQKALEAPYFINLPYRQQGYFAADKSRALGLQFKVKAGERITFSINKKEAAPFALYADVYQQEGSSYQHLLAAPKDSTQFSIDIAETGTYILRLQPELHNTGEYHLSVAVGPSLGFPVSGATARVGSFWGARRDGGKRSHEGIDIFAPKLTPAIAAADAIVTGVREGGIGGKTVWLKTKDKNIYLYYAHLDKQAVQEGQAVKKGDVVGLVGNTGNARTTPSHLHFGVYTGHGPIDPFPFVNTVVKTAPALAAKKINGALKVTKAIKNNGGTLATTNTVLVPLAATANGYIAEHPNGALIQVPFTAVQVVPLPVKPAAVASTTTTTSKGS